MSRKNFLFHYFIKEVFRSAHILVVTLVSPTFPRTWATYTESGEIERGDRGESDEDIKKEEKARESREEEMRDGERGEERARERGNRREREREERRRESNCRFSLRNKLSY